MIISVGAWSNPWGFIEFDQAPTNYDHIVILINKEDDSS